MTTDPIQALRDLAEHPFTDWRDAADVLPLALEALSSLADDFCDDCGDGVCDFAVQVGHVRNAVRSLAERVPERKLPEPVAEDAWEWRWPNELVVGAQVRFPRSEGGFGEWHTITSRTVKVTPGQDVTVLCLGVERQAYVGHDEMVQARLTDPDAVADFWAAKRERMVDA